MPRELYIMIINIVGYRNQSQSLQLTNHILRPRICARVHVCYSNLMRQIRFLKSERKSQTLNFAKPNATTFGWIPKILDPKQTMQHSRILAIPLEAGCALIGTYCLSIFSVVFRFFLFVYRKGKLFLQLNETHRQIYF